MLVQDCKTYVLGEYRLEPDKRLLSRNGEPVRLTNKPFQVLLYLIEHRDRLVSRNELLDRFWEGKDVYDVTLTKCTGAIRKALSDPSENPRFIETRYAEGYRYIGPLAERSVQAGPSFVEVDRTREVRIVLEEEIQTAPLEAEKDFGVETLARPVASRKTNQFARPVLLTLALTIIVLVTVASILLFSRGGAESRTQAIRSIAVLPLKNLTDDPAQDYFSDGMTESFISELSRIQGLKVVSRTSVFSLKGKDIDPREVGRLLAVEAVLEGHVRKSDDRVRVTARLVSTKDGRVLWNSETYNRPLGDIFALQDEIACSVVAGLRVKLCVEGEARKRYTDNVEAYQAYLKGRYFLNKRTGEGITKSIEYFQRASEIDANYALAYAGLADSYQKAVWFMNSPPDQLMEKAQAAARRALELDETLTEGHVAMAAVYYGDWDLSNTVRESELAVKLNPGSADAHHAHAYSLITIGRPDEAISEARQALELDPLDVVMNVDVGEILLYARHYDEAIDALNTAIEMDSTRVNAHSNLARAYEQKGMYTEAFAEEMRAEELAGASPEAITALKEAFASSGMSGFWQKRLVLYKQRSKQSYFPPFHLAGAYARIGEKDHALDCLMRAYAERSPLLMDIGVSPEFDSLRSDARFSGLLRRVGLPD
jgi:TolB-like protein/DNA-binding winged helix-turn-helix (wHTH) protein